MAERTHDIPRIVVAGTASGVGKTTVVVALARAIAARGLHVALFKCGPDYLDPTYHARAVGAPSETLDAWMMGRDAVRRAFAAGARGADVAIVEGMMGLFDGPSATTDEGSTAELAKWLEAPVVLVVDASGMARSIAAVVQGFTSFDPALRVSAVIANEVGGRGHIDLLRSAQRSPPLLGGLPRDAAHAFPERHLGLHAATDETVPEAHLDHWAGQADRWLGIQALLALARAAKPLAISVPDDAPSPTRCRIGVARDGAFHFYYPENLRCLERLGAELVPFSPVSDAALPDVDGLLFGGGYPELFASRLTANEAMREAVRAFAERGGPVYAECGGLMYLADAIVTADGTSHPMVGIIQGTATMADRLQAIGYVEVTTTADTILGPVGTRFRGHEFRHSELSPAPGGAARVYRARGPRGDDASSDGFAAGNTVASYVHAHWASNDSVPAHFVAACERFQRARRAAP